VPGHGDDPLGSQPLGGQHATKSDSAVAHHHNGPAGGNLGRDGGVVARGHHVGQGEQVPLEGVVRLSGERHFDQGGLGKGHAHCLALAAVDLHP
jgi:hypothetical protein